MHLRAACNTFTSVALSVFTEEAYLRAARNTFVFPGMAGVEMALGKGHGEMETGGGGREERGGGGETEDGGEEIERWQRLVGCFMTPGLN